MYIYLKNKSNHSLNSKFEWINFVNNIDYADKFEFNQYIFNDKNLSFKTIYIDKQWDLFWFDLDIIWKKYSKYFLICNLNDEKLVYKVIFYFDNLLWIALKTLSNISKVVSLNNTYINWLNEISTKDFMSVKNIDDNFLVKNDLLIPEYLDINENLYKLYDLLSLKLQKFNDDFLCWKIFFKDFVLSLLEYRYWSYSLFFLNSNLKFKISNFFNNYDEIISLQIPVARSKFLKDLFETLLLQTNKNFKIIIWIDWYDEKQKKDILEICKKYKNKFDNFQYFVNKKNLGVWKTRWKLLKKDKISKYVVFLDDDVFLDYKAIENLYKNINSYRHMWLYSIENVDVRYDINYKDYIFMESWFSQPGVFTNRNIVDRLPVYVSQEETPIIFDRFYRDLLDLKYHKSFDKCSLDLFYNRTLEIICWNINIKWIYQFNRVWHRFHQTKEKWFLLKEYEYNLYILDKITSLTNKNKTYDVLIKSQILKQDELFYNSWI